MGRLRVRILACFFCQIFPGEVKSTSSVCYPRPIPTVSCKTPSSLYLRNDIVVRKAWIPLSHYQGLSHTVYLQVSFQKRIWNNRGQCARQPTKFRWCISKRRNWVSKTSNIHPLQDLFKTNGILEYTLPNFNCRCIPLEMCHVAYSAEMKSLQSTCWYLTHSVVRGDGFLFIRLWGAKIHVSSYICLL